MSQALKLKPSSVRLNDSILEKSVSADNSFQIFTIRWLKKYLRTSVEQRGEKNVCRGGLWYMWIHAV